MVPPLASGYVGEAIEFTPTVSVSFYFCFNSQGTVSLVRAKKPSAFVGWDLLFSRWEDNPRCKHPPPPTKQHLKPFHKVLTGECIKALTGVRQHLDLQPVKTPFPQKILTFTSWGSQVAFRDAPPPLLKGFLRIGKQDKIWGNIWYGTECWK